MAKKPKPKPVHVTTEMIGKAAQTGTVKDLVALAEAFNRAGVHGPFSVELPLFCAMHIAGKGFRRGNINAGLKFGAGSIRLGKRDGLIFVFTPEQAIDRAGETIEHIELAWDDVVNSFPPLIDRMDAVLGESSNSFVKRTDAAVRDAISRNPAMHKVLSEGFSLAQTHSKQEAVSEQLEEVPGFGMF